MKDETGKRLVAFGHFAGNAGNTSLKQVVFTYKIDNFNVV